MKAPYKWAWGPHPASAKSAVQGMTVLISLAMISTAVPWTVGQDHAKILLHAFTWTLRVPGLTSYCWKFYALTTSHLIFFFFFYGKMLISKGVLPAFRAQCWLWTCHIPSRDQKLCEFYPFSGICGWRCSKGSWNVLISPFSPCISAISGVLMNPQKMVQDWFNVSAWAGGQRMHWFRFLL